MTPTVRLNSGGLGIGDETRTVLSGEVHYWRIDPSNWAKVLDAVVETGFTMISTYVPWCVHETDRGSYDFSKGRNIKAFLAMVHERGLLAMVRVGPDTGAELETSGWPKRIFDDADCQARRPDGEPYLLITATGHGFPPSYASAITLREVRAWYEEVIPRLAPLQYPAGPIAACQVDNEMGFHFQPNTFAMDYHPDAVRQWHSFLSGHFSAIDALNQVWGTSYGAWTDIEPPTDGSDHPEARRIAWVMWREHHRRSTIAEFAGWARELGMTSVPITHNDYPRTATPMDLGALESTGAVDWAAADVYATRPGGRFVRDLARTLAGGSKLPFLAELGAGWLTLPWLLPLETSAEDEAVISLRGFFSGAKAGNVYMLVERDRWYGSPLSVDGTLRPSAAMYPRLRALLDEIGWTELRRERSVLLVENRAEQRRVAARDTLGAVVPCFSQLLPLDQRLTRIADPHTDDVERWDRELARVLDHAGVDLDRAASSSLPDLGVYDLVVVPVFELLDRTAVVSLIEAARRGTVVVVGPGQPVRDEWLSAVSGDLAQVSHAITEPDELLPLLPGSFFTRDHSAVDLHEWRAPGRTVLAVFNSRAETVTATVSFPGRRRFRTLWAGPHESDGVAVTALGQLAVELMPYEARVYAVDESA
ncbi:MAG: beta-galactosidase [Acidimicrobiales bacterium]